VHNEPHPWAGKKVRLLPNVISNGIGGYVDIGESVFLLEDWYDRVTGTSWREGPVTPATANYVWRLNNKKMPRDDEVVYGKVGHLGYLIHEHELGELVDAN
jgi:hypothetical protein